MTAYSKLSGSSASCTLQPPTMFSSVTISSDALRSICTSLSDRVSAGETTMLSPVWTPTGSTFSMEQMAITFPFASRIVSNSISFQPAIDFSIRICVIGERSSPFPAITLSSSSSRAIPPPVPPSVNAGRTMTGYPIDAAACSASSTVTAIPEATTGWPIFSIALRKRSRSSAFLIASTSVPSRRTPCSSSHPFSESFIASVSPVCPPSPASRLSGFSFSMIRFSVSSFSGSR